MKLKSIKPLMTLIIYLRHLIRVARTIPCKKIRRYSCFSRQRNCQNLVELVEERKGVKGERDKNGKRKTEERTEERKKNEEKESRGRKIGRKIKVKESSIKERKMKKEDRSERGEKMKRKRERMIEREIRKV